jgi:sugar phosphate isomerase/epimerase
MSSVMFSGLSLEDFCEQAATLGFKGIDLWGPFGNCRHLAEARELGAIGFRKLLEKHGLEVGAWTTYRTKVDQQGFPGFAEFIGACGCGVVVRESKYATVARDQLEDALRGFFKELQPEIELARKHKVRLAIENHGSAVLDTLESIERFTKLNPAPDVVGIALAPYHLQNRKVSVTKAIRACGGQLLFFYAWQAGGGTKQLPGHGPVDLAPWLHALAEQDYRQWMTPFMHGELAAAEMTTAVETAARYLRGIR